MVNAKKVAEYILATQEEVSNLKLQKLLFYAQGCFLAYHDRELFSDEIEAWDHGPVVRDVYESYKDYKSSSIDKVHEKPNLHLTEDEIDTLNEAIEVFGKYSAWHLRELTHNEMPWAKAYNLGQNTVIKTEEIKDHFKKKYLA